jgi:hypothetical protein
VVAAESGKRAVVWSIATGQRITDLASKVGDQLILSDPADYSLVAVPADETTFALYDGKTWKAATTLPGHSARFSRDGRVLTVVEGNRPRTGEIPQAGFAYGTRL